MRGGEVGRGVDEVQKNIRARENWTKKNSWTPINPKKYSCYGLKKIHTRSLITKKYSCGSKIPLPSPITFLMVRPLGNSYYLLSFTSRREHPVFWVWTAVRRLIIYYFQFNVCLNLSPFSFQQFLCIKYTTRLRSKYLCQVNLISKKYIFW